MVNLLVERATSMWHDHWPPRQKSGDTKNLPQPSASSVELPQSMVNLVLIVTLKELCSDNKFWNKVVTMRQIIFVHWWFATTHALWREGWVWHIYRGGDSMILKRQGLILFPAVFSPLLRLTCFVLTSVSSIVSDIEFWFTFCLGVRIIGHENCSCESWVHHFV